LKPQYKADKDTILRACDLLGDKIWQEGAIPQLQRKMGLKHNQARDTVVGARTWLAMKEVEPPKETALYTKHSLAHAILKLLKSAIGLMDIRELCHATEASEQDVRDALDLLVAEKFNIRTERGKYELSPDLPPGPTLKITTDEFMDKRGWAVIGLVSDTHLGSRYAREDVLAAVYDIFQQAGVKRVLHAGNLIDGYKAQFNHFELKEGLTGLTAQVEYAVQYYPQREGIITNFITADDHEGWWSRPMGFNVGEYIEMKARRMKRQDLRYQGHIEADIKLTRKNGRSARARLMHPGGGTAYALSYGPQKMVESYAEYDKPVLLATGHTHKAEMIYYGGVYVIQAGTTQDQTGFMRKHKLQAHVGAWLLHYFQDTDGIISRLSAEWLRFGPREEYESKDKYVTW